MGKVLVRTLRAALDMEPGVWFFGAFTCLLTLGYLEVMSRVLAMS